MSGGLHIYTVDSILPSKFTSYFMSPRANLTIISSMSCGLNKVILNRLEIALNFNICTVVINL